MKCVPIPEGHCGVIERGYTLQLDRHEWAIALQYQVVRLVVNVFKPPFICE